MTGKGPGIHSMTWRLFACIAGCIALLLAVVIALNSLALKPFYMGQKEKQIGSTFDAVNAVCDDQVQLQNALAAQDDRALTVVLWSGRQILYSSGNTDRVLLPYQVSQPPGTYTVTVSSEEPMLHDAPADAKAIRLIGTLRNGWHIHLRTPVAAIEESVGVTNRFLLVSGGVALLFSLLVSLIASRRFTQPIRRLAAEADRVARLDFSERHQVTGRDEVAQLGQSIRTMSLALEQTIGQLQADIAQKEEQDRSRRHFIANVSHELKTPLALMSTYAEGLREDVAGGGENRDFYCEVIEDEARKVNQLLRRMTMLMQLESGSEQLETEAFDLNELLTNLAEKNAPAAADKQVTVTLPMGEPVCVQADPYLMEHVLQNYWQNALNHVTPGGDITATVLPLDGGRVRVEIYNSGSHIPAEELPRIWESFHKVDKARTRAYGGSGIGLSVVAAIMKAHGMPYGVENRRDGVAFYIELPTANL